MAPESFTGPQPLILSSLYVPVAMIHRLAGESAPNPLERRADRASGMFVHGRLRPGISLKQAAAEAALGHPIEVVSGREEGRLIFLGAAHDLAASKGTEFIYQPGWFSVITALVAGAAGTLSLTSAKSAALVGVFISVTTIPAAGNGALALVFGRFHDAAGSALQLLINLTGIVLAAYLVLLARGHSRRRDDRPERELSAN